MIEGVTMDILVAGRAKPVIGSSETAGHVRSSALSGGRGHRPTSA